MEQTVVQAQFVAKSVTPAAVRALHDLVHLPGGRTGPIDPGKSVPKLAVVVDTDRRTGSSASSRRERHQRNPEHQIAVSRVDSLQIGQRIGARGMKPSLRDRILLRRDGGCGKEHEQERAPAQSKPGSHTADPINPIPLHLGCLAA